MKKTALWFVSAVFVPALVLAWLATNSVRDQELLVERQRHLLYQSAVDSASAMVNARFDELLESFKAYVSESVAQRTPISTASDFDNRLRATWPLAEVGFAVSLKGEVLSPSMFDGPKARQFRVENDRFLCSTNSLEVYWNSPKGAISLSKLDQKENLKRTPAATTEVPASEAIDSTKLTASPRRAAGDKDKDLSNVPVLSKLAAEEAQFRKLVSAAREGTIARFLEDRLTLLFWFRPSEDLVFGSQIHIDRLVPELQSAIQVESALRDEVALALVDERGRPVLTAPEGFSTAGRHAEAVTEVGERLPHWEVALYRLSPLTLSASTASLRFTLGLIIAILVGSIAVGGWILMADVKRQLVLSQQKTNFVSNVSHELKTPLTSIRMFAELLLEDQTNDPSKRRRYSQIITSETTRLTRLINNVLDFAKLERGERSFSFSLCDLTQLLRDTVASYGPDVEARRSRIETNFPDNPVPVVGDHDALLQVFLNLISNAEKYGGEGKPITIELRTADSRAEVLVMDQGPGVPKGYEEKIFEQFVRVDDALASGVQGSGLGLTLARQIARAHNGDIYYKNREGGGSCFHVELPLASSSEPPIGKNS